jgi:drug/metabolite transporter (DMT)-like permease
LCCRIALPHHDGVTQTLAAPPAAEPRFSESRKAAVAAGITVLLWASAFVAIRDVGHTLSAAPLALIRLAVAAVALTVLVVARRGRRVIPVPLSRRTFGLIAACGVLWLAGYTVALNAGEQHVDAGTAALLVNVAPLLIAFGAGLFLGEGFPRALIAGSLVALGGVAVISVGSSGDRDWIGVALCLLAALLYTAGVLIQKVVLRYTDGLTTTWLACLVGTAVLLPWTPQLVSELRDASLGAILAAVYLGLFPTAIGFSTWAYALQRMDAGRLSANTYVVPTVSVLMSWAILSEVPTVYGLIGGAISLVGVAISRRRRRQG